MAETKYGKCIVIEPKTEKDWEGSGVKLRMEWECITKPSITVEEPRSDDFDQILCFMGGDPMDFYVFEAEVELSLGEEMEKHKIDSVTSIYVPKGLKYGPIKYNRVDKPIRFYRLILAP